VNEGPEATAARAPRRLRSFAVALTAIALGGLAIRLVAALSGPDPGYLTDATFYRLQAVLLAQGHGFADPFAFVQTGRVIPTAFHPPLFSVFLAGVYKLGFHSVDAARVASCIAGSFTIVFVGLLGREVRSPRAGLLAAGIAAVTPNLWVPDGTLYSEGLAALFVAAALYSAYRLLRTPTVTTAVALGGAIGLAALTRPETLALSVIVVIPVVWRTAASRRHKVWLVAIASLTTLVVVLPWMVRSVGLFEKPVLFSTNSTAVLGFANCPSTFHGESLGSWLQRCPDETQRLRRVRIGAHPDEAELASARADQGLRYLRGNLGTFLTTVVWARVARTWSLLHPFAVKQATANEDKTRNELVAGVLALWLSLVLAGFGIVALRRARTVPLWPLVAPAVVATVVSVLAYGTPRFRVVAEPSVAVFAAVGIDALLRRWRGESRTVVTDPATTP
jgi:4-amino-4-deoxy-L-arabinose transferase-like glycosyltransferase